MPHLNIEISDEFQLPTVYLTGTVDMIEEALTIGAFVQQHVHRSRVTGDLKTIQEQAAADLATLMAAKDAESAQHAAAIRTLRSELQEAVIAAATAEKVARKEERERTMLEMQAAVERAQQRCEAAEERRRLLENERAADITKAEQRVRDLLQQTLVVREEQLRESQEALKAFESAYKAQVAELRDLNDFVRRKTQNVKVKGNEFEEAFRDILLRAFGILDGFGVTDTAKNGIGHAGDFLVTMCGHKTMWEVKHYDKVVQKAEVEKFRRDMLENGDVRIGVMLSKSTDITGKTSKGLRELEFVEGKLLVYVSRFETFADPVDFLQSLLPLFQIWWEMQREDETAEVFADTVKELDRLLTDLTKKRMEWRVHRARLEETTRWMSDVVEDAESRVESLLRLMRSGSGADTLDIPEGIFRSLHADERVRETVAVLLETYAAGAGEVRLNDLANFLASKKSMAKTTARQHVLAALQDSAVVAAPGKPTLVRGLCKKE